MKIKFILIISILFLFTGCSVDYKLKISDNKITENMSVLEDNIDLATTKISDIGMSFEDISKKYGMEKSIYSSYYNNSADEGCVLECDIYEHEYINNSKNIGFVLSNDFNYNTYSDTTIAKEMLPSFEETFDGRYLTISGGSSWNFINGYENLDNIKISIETDYPVISSNGDNKGNVYNWNIYRGDTSGLEKMYIVIDTKGEVSKDNKMLYLLLVIFIVIVMVIMFILWNKNKEQNRV